MLPLIEKCPTQLWEGVECDLPAGHSGLHHRSGYDHGAALSWRSSASGLHSSSSQSELRHAVSGK